jgi:hypothetical protein
MVKTYLNLSIIKQNELIEELENQKNEIKTKINKSNDEYINLVKKIVFGKWIRIDQECLLKDVIED